MLVSGPRGIGKTRLAAELAREALRRRMAVHYTGAGTDPGDALAAILRAEESERPTLLIVDDADDAEPRRCSIAPPQLGRDSSGRRLLLLVLHARPEPPSAPWGAWRNGRSSSVRSVRRP